MKYSTKKCIICQNWFEITLKPLGSTRKRPIRNERMVTCSKKCSRIYTRVSQTISQAIRRSLEKKYKVQKPKKRKENDKTKD